jgi:hypothetical protein
LHCPIRSPTLWKTLSESKYEGERSPRVTLRITIALYAAHLEGAVKMVQRVRPQPFLMVW